jgi:GNAT superfamily N-acetyltransferase
MSNTKTHKYEVLSSAQVDFYQSLTYPAYRNQLQNCDGSSILAIGVDDELRPIGLVLAKYSSVERRGEILSVFVLPDRRTQGIGSELLDRMEQLLAQQGCLEVSLVFVPNATTASFEHMLARGNWRIPQPRMLLAESDCVRWDNQNLVDTWQDYLRRSPLPPAFEIFPWAEVLPQELEKIHSQEDIWYPAILSPCQEIESIEHTNSLGLRHQGEIVGWMVTHRIAPDKIRYTSLFIREDLQRVGRAVPSWTMLAESILLQAKHNQVARASFTVWDNNGKMLRIVHRRIAPFLHSARYSMGTSKAL